MMHLSKNAAECNASGCLLHKLSFLVSKTLLSPKKWIRYYDDHNILDEITDESVDLILDEHLRDEILSDKRKRKLKNITIQALNL